MLGGIKKLGIVIGTSIFSIAVLSIGYSNVTKAYDQSNRNEHYAPNEYNVPVTSFSGYSKIYENNNFEYYYSSSKTILKIKNKATGFVWSTGADTETKTNVVSSCGNVVDGSSEFYACAIDVGPQGNGSDMPNYYAEINQLLSFTYLEGGSKSNTVRTLSNSNVSTQFYQHKEYANEFIFKTAFSVKGCEININMRFTFNESGFDLHIYDEDISGANATYLESIMPLPRFGQSGGKLIACKVVDAEGNPATEGACSFSDTSNVYNNPTTNLPGYIFVPDGSGALIRFDDVKYYGANEFTYFDMYGDPYRTTYTENEFQSNIYVQEPDYVPTKQISMPVWGVAYGNNQDAFVSYVTGGDEYFGLIYKGRSTKMEYSAITPRFEKNRTYNYYFTSSASLLSLTDAERYRYDIGVSYKFLNGDGSDGTPAANYVGMALTYRDYLVSNGKLNATDNLLTGPKVDFLICDVKKGIFGFSDVVVTSTNDITRMLNDLAENGVENITSTLYGWQNGGMSIAKPWKTDFNTVAGGKGGFEEVIETASELNYKVNFYQQYGLINAEQVTSFNAYCVKALSRDYGAYVLADKEKPITWWEYVNPNVAGTWLNKQASELSKLGENVGITTGGISTQLIPDYGKSISYDDAKESLSNSTKEASATLSLSGDTPNSYLWGNYDSFYNVSVYNSQLQCETDSVPFLEIVVGGLVNLYAEYSNFSFYDTQSQLKMIDFNLNPSFIVSDEEDVDIMYTNARDWFSTGYASYKETILEINSNVTPFLKLLQGKTLVNRVVDESNGELGLYINTYANYEEGKVVENSDVTIAINYLSHAVSYVKDGKTYTIAAESALQLD